MKDILRELASHRMREGISVLVSSHVGAQTTVKQHAESFGLHCTPQVRNNTSSFRVNGGQYVFVNRVRCSNPEQNAAAERHHFLVAEKGYSPQTIGGERVPSTSAASSNPVVK